MSDVSGLISAIAQLVGVLVWPAVLIFFFVFFRKSLAEFFRNLGEFSFKVPVIEASGKRRQEVVAAAALGAAVATHASDEGPAGEVADPRDAAAALPSPQAQRRLEGSRILWVDDRPDANRFERQALEALGVQIDRSRSTEDALEKIRRRPYDLIISDMGRPPDSRAGYTLLRKLREDQVSTPFVIYSGSRAPEHVKEARQLGAIGATNSPEELITTVTRALTARP